MVGSLYRRVRMAWPRQGDIVWEFKADVVGNKHYQMANLSDGGINRFYSQDFQEKNMSALQHSASSRKTYRSGPVVDGVSELLLR